MNQSERDTGRWTRMEISGRCLMRCELMRIDPIPHGDAEARAKLKQWPANPALLKSRFPIVSSYPWNRLQQSAYIAYIGLDLPRNGIRRKFPHANSYRPAARAHATARLMLTRMSGSGCFGTACRSRQILPRIPPPEHTHGPSVFWVWPVQVVDQ
jgi:hypothetical protein